MCIRDRLNVESRREVERLAEVSAEQGKPARVAVRINPDFKLKNAGMRMGGGPKPVSYTHLDVYKRQDY